MKKKTAGRIIGAKLSFSNKITKILDKYGNQKIRSIYIGVNYATNITTINYSIYFLLYSLMMILLFLLKRIP